MKFAKQIQIGSRKADRFGSTSIPTKKNIHGNTEKVGQLAQHCKIGFTLSTFPHSDGRLRYTHFLSNPSSTAQALRIVFAATGEVTNPFLTDVKRQETLQIGTTAKPFVLHNGEVVTVTTSLSNMHIMLASRGVQTEITNKAVWPVAWLKLHPGENLFRYGAASGEQSLQVQIWHRQSYGGA